MNFIYKIYFFLPNFSKYGYLGKAVNYSLRVFLKFYFDLTVPNKLSKSQTKQNYALNTKERDEKYVVSLTSFPSRIDHIWITIETILRQRFKPDEIILWLGKKEFENVQIPDTLLSLKSRGLTISFCEDLRSHTKYYYALQQFPNANVITLDDDCYYPNDVLTRLVEIHKNFPDYICSNRVHKLAYNNSNILLPYRKWKHNFKGIKKPSHLLVQTGVGGVLYTPNSLHKDVFQKEIFQKECYFADDLWLKLHAFRNGTKIVTGDYFNKDFISVSATQKEKLVLKNSFQGGNDAQFKAVCDHFQIAQSKFID